MNTRRLISAFFLALFCSGLLTWQLSRHLSRPAPVSATKLPTWKIVVASKDMQAGDVITAASLKTVDWPSSAIPVGSFTQQQEVAGRVLLSSISSGELVLTHDLAAPDTGTGLPALIPDGMRAISIHADETTGVSGFVTPNSHVDILVTYPAAAGAGFVSAMVLQNARVLAVGQKDDAAKEAKLGPLGTITLLTTPQDAARLTTATSLGKILLILRNGADRHFTSGLSQMTFAPDVVTNRRTTDTGSLKPLHTAAERSFKSSFTVETLSGGKKIEQSFEQEQP